MLLAIETQQSELTATTSKPDLVSKDKIKLKTLPKFKFICEYIDQQSGGSEKTNKDNKGTDKIDKSRGSSGKISNVVTEHSNRTGNESFSNIFTWHKLLAPPPKQMIVIDRMHSGARRFVVLDFGSPILLTDLIIPACDELASLHIDIWCFDEETDCVRLVVAPDIGSKTLVLSDLLPPPICRYMKITIMGRVGMSSTKCKIPLGSFFGHLVVLESDGYGDILLDYMKHQSNTVQAQIKALQSLHEDVHCRYSLASCKLLEMLTPLLNADVSNVAHMQAFITKQRSEEDNSSAFENGKITSIYEVCKTITHLSLKKNFTVKYCKNLLQKHFPFF